MRLIDADALLKRWCSEVCKEKPNCKEDCMLYDYLTIDSLSPTIGPESHWIPCSEQEPRVADEYYVTWTTSDSPISFIGIFEYDGFKWIPDTLPYKDIKVIAWRHLPEPWKGEEE